MLKREIAMRLVVYPKLVTAKKLTQETADRRIFVLQNVLAREEANAEAILASRSK